MFLQRIPRKKGDEVYDYWALTKTVRTANGPRHQMVSYLGKLDAEDQEYYNSWDAIAALLDGRRGNLQQGEDRAGKENEELSLSAYGQRNTISLLEESQQCRVRFDGR